MSRTMTAPPRRPLNHPALLARTAGVTGVLFALAVGLSWAHQRDWPAAAVALTVIVLSLAAGQVFGAGRDSDGADLAAGAVLAAVVAWVTVRAVLVGWHSVVLEVRAVAVLALLVAGGVYGNEALTRFRAAVR